MIAFALVIAALVAICIVVVLAFAIGVGKFDHLPPDYLPPSYFALVIVMIAVIFVAGYAAEQTWQLAKLAPEVGSGRPAEAPP